MAIHCSNPTTESDAPTRGAELLAWPVLAATIATFLNDHVGKAAWPGFVTGKVSDFAGLFFFPFLLTTLLGRLRVLPWAALATAVVFTAVKLLGVSNRLCHVVADPTDLVALVSPLLACWYAHRRWPCVFRA